jgi:hypothetical protein
LDIADTGIANGQALLDIATKLLDKHQDQEFGPAVARLSDALKALRADVKHMRRYNIYAADDICTDDVTVH